MSECKECQRWKRIAAYLASCHAATAEYEGQLKRTSRSSKDRFASICQKAMDYLKGVDSPPEHFSSTHDQEIDHAIDRCKSISDKLKSTNKILED